VRFFSRKVSPNDSRLQSESSGLEGAAPRRFKGKARSAARLRLLHSPLPMRFSKRDLTLNCYFYEK
jgi:hypothetical protein